MKKFLRMLFLCVCSCSLSSCDVLLACAAALLDPTMGYMAPPNPYMYMNAASVAPAESSSTWTPIWTPTYSQPQGVYGGYSTSSNAGASTGSSSSGSTSESMLGDKPCPTCRGTGVCNNCNGKGWHYDEYFGNGKLHCTNCNGNGKCPWCKGTGKTYGLL